MRGLLVTGLVVVFSSAGFGLHAQQSVPRAHPSHPYLYAQGWTGYGYPGMGGHGFTPYYSSPHFPYLYFYEQYAHEAEESRRAADEYEASLAREGKLTGPAPVGAFSTDYLPRSPLRQKLTLDGQPVTPSPSGAPLVIDSGDHTLQIGVPSEN